MDRRSFLVSACGVTSTLASFNAAYAAAGRTGGFYEMPREAPLDLFAARSAVDGNEFIFDVQGHFVNPTGRLAEDPAADGEAIAILHRRAAVASRIAAPATATT